MEQLIIILFAAVVGIAKWGMKKAKEQREEEAMRNSPRQVQSPSRGGMYEGEEERARKFFEALGVPPGSVPLPPLRRAAPPAQPPAMVRARTVPRHAKQPKAPRPARAGGPVLPIPARATPAVLQPQTGEFAPVPKRSIFEAAETIADSVRAMEPASSKAPRAAAVVLRNDLLTMLKTPEDIRSAIVLREILGTPRGFQPAHEDRAFPFS